MAKNNSAELRRIAEQLRNIPKSITAAVHPRSEKSLLIQAEAAGRLLMEAIALGAWPQSEFIAAQMKAAMKDPGNPFAAAWIVFRQDCLRILNGTTNYKMGYETPSWDYAFADDCRVVAKLIDAEADATESESALQATTTKAEVIPPPKSQSPTAPIKLPKTTPHEAGEILLKSRQAWGSLEQAAEIVRKDGKCGGLIVRTCSKSTIKNMLEIDDSRFQPLRDRAKFKKRDKAIPAETASDEVVEMLLEVKNLPEDIRQKLQGADGANWVQRNPRRAKELLSAKTQANTADTETD